MAETSVENVAQKVTQEHEIISKFNKLRVMISLLKGRAKGIRRFDINPVVWFKNYRIVSHMMKVIDLNGRLIDLEERKAILYISDPEEINEIVKKYHNDIMDLNAKVNVWLFNKSPLAKHYSIS